MSQMSSENTIFNRENQDKCENYKIARSESVSKDVLGLGRRHDIIGPNFRTDHRIGRPQTV